MSRAKYARWKNVRVLALVIELNIMMSHAAEWRRALILQNELRHAYNLEVTKDYVKRSKGLIWASGLTKQVHILPLIQAKSALVRPAWQPAQKTAEVT